MPNPNRPNTGEPIPAEWGQMVADRVVRRYRSRDERDVDMAGVGDVTGQLVTIAPPGVPPWFEQHDGSGWRRVPGGPLIGGELLITSYAPGVDGITLPQLVGWLSGGMEAFGSDDWNFVGDRRILVVPQPGLYRVSGYLVAYNHGYSAQWWYAEVSRVIPSYDPGHINDVAKRRASAQGGTPNVVYAWVISAYSSLVACNGGDGLMVCARFGPVPGASVEGGAFTVTFEADLPPGYVPAPPPSPTSAGDPGDWYEPPFPGQLPDRSEMVPRPPWPDVPADA